LKTVVCIFYFLSISLAAIYTYKKPEYNWDMLPYMALVLNMDYKDEAFIHQAVYNNAKQNIPPKDYAKLVDSSNSYRKRMHETSSVFFTQLPFYIVKPLYLSLVYLFYKAGIALPHATMLPSITAYLLMSILLWRWLQKYLPFYTATAVSLCILLSAPLLGVAAMSGPDGLSAILLFGSLYFILEKPRVFPLFILLIAAIFTRVDNFIAGAGILSLLAFRKDTGSGAPGDTKPISTLLYSSLLLAMAGCYFLITLPVRHYGWSLFYYPAFASHYNFSVLWSNFLNGLYHSHFSLFVLLLLWILLDGPALPGQITIDRQLALTILLIMLARFILYPELSDRFNIPYYLAAIILFARKRGPFAKTTHSTPHAGQLS
jgi:hypothetical protein